MQHLPIFMNLKDRDCLVVGGGRVAARKADLLRQAGARVTVVAPSLARELEDLNRRGRLTHREGEFSPQDLDGKVLVIAATDRSVVNRWVYEQARLRNLPVNVADAPELCSFILPAIVDRAPVTIAVSTGGSSPVFARHIKARLETLIPSGYGRLAGLLGRFRDRVKLRFRSVEERRRFWEETLEGPVAEMAITGRETEADACLERSLAGAFELERRGEVFLIGAGPGDPDLMTFRALRLLQRADVVVYDRLVSESILDLARREAERIYVGKCENDHSLPQEEISRLLVTLAQEGKTVARLKGGDPFLFGRGGEEIQELAAAGIAFQVVPGITAATGCAAYSGIPLTHRDYAQSVRFVTGHTRDGRLDLDWKSLAVERQTVVFYMGLGSAETICRELMAHGRAADTPIALVEQGTTAHHRVVTGTLADFPQRVAQAAARSPSLIIVGEVVRLHDSLGWYQPGAETAPAFPHHHPRPDIREGRVHAVA